MNEQMYNLDSPSNKPRAKMKLIRPVRKPLVVATIAKGHLSLTVSKPGQEGSTSVFTWLGH